MVQKTRATTIQQKFGFKDEDLRTPGHDEIMLWLNGHISDVVSSLSLRNEWDPFDIDDLNQELGLDISADNLPARNPIEVTRTTWEAPVKSGKYVVGFIDLQVRCIWDGLSWCVKTKEWSLDRVSYPWLIHFEVKTLIPSLGELIRQIQLYKEYQGGLYIVVSPDARFVDILKEQKIGFYHYAPGGEV